MPEFTFDGESMEEMARTVREAALLLRAETDKVLAEVAALAATAAKEVASQAGSTSIPAHIHFEVAPGIARVSDTSPLGVLWDLGNKKHKKKTTFSHPLFGNRGHWYDQPRHPIFSRTRTLIRPEVTKSMNGAWDNALKRYRTD
jgi:hypothetical protein